MNLKKYRMLLVLIMAPFILLSAVSSARAEDGYWKLEKKTSTPRSYPANRLPENIEICQRAKGHTVELKWTELPDIVIPNKKYSVTVNAILKENLNQVGPYWSLGLYFTPRWPSGGGSLCQSHAGGDVGGLAQGPQTGTYEYPKGSESGKSQIQARIETSCTFYDFIYIWYSGPPPAGTDGTSGSGGGKADEKILVVPVDRPGGQQAGPCRSTIVDLTPAGGKKGSPRIIKDTETGAKIETITFSIDDGSWLRLKSHGEDGYAPPKMSLSVALADKVRTTAVVIVGNLDHAHLLPQGQTITRMTVRTTEGDIGFEIKAGIHMSEWNGPVKHTVAPTSIGGNRFMPVFWLPRPMTVTGLRFDYVEVSKGFDHGSDAPGFCLRGITLTDCDSSTGATPGGTGGTSGSAGPSGGMALRVDKVKASPGETVSVPVYLDNSTGLANVNFNLIYDVRKVVVGNAEKGSLVPATTSLVANPRQAGMVRVGLAGSQDITGSGILVRIPFKAVGPAGGRADLKLAITTKGSASGGKPAVQAIDGWIEIGGPGGTGTGGSSTGGGTTGTGGTSTGGKTDPGVKPKPPGGIPGDVNGNGRLEAIDALQALKMSVGLIDENLIADVDGDGTVTSTDARLILTKVVGK